MLYTKLQPASSVSLPSQNQTQNDLDRLFVAAIVSVTFREMLLHQPEVALANGYLGQKFVLTDLETTTIKSIRATSLADFAKKLLQALDTQ